MGVSFHARAADAIRAKANRLMFATSGKPDGAERRRRALALKAIAERVEGGAQGLRAWTESAATSEGVGSADMERAANEVYALALRRAEQGTQRNLGAPVRSGWTMSAASEVPVHLPTLREAAAHYELALALRYEPYWHYSQGILLESMGSFAEAIRVFESVQGSYAVHAQSQAERCRKKLAGGYDPARESRKHLDSLISQLDRKGLDSSAIRYAKDVLGESMDELHASARTAGAPSETEADFSDLERAALAAQVFAEHLVDGDFGEAHAMLASDLQHLTPAQLQETYQNMAGGCADDDEVGDEAVVMVISSQADMPNMELEDLGWVYVAISNDSFNEAITVTITEEDGEARIRELEWGRP